jgi:hypothetical protein
MSLISSAYSSASSSVSGVASKIGSATSNIKLPSIDINKQLKNAKQSIKDKLKELKGIYSPEAGINLANDLPKDCFYPSNLKQADAKFPCIRFQTKGSLGEGKGDQPYNIYLPIPDGLEFTDAASFPGHDVGIMGGAANDLVKNVSSAVEGSEGLIDGIKNAAGALTMSAANVLGQLKGVSLGDAAAFASDQLYGTKALAARGKIVAPNTTSMFGGNDTRSFSFSWPMVARTPEEARSMINIQRIFRLFTYASSSTGSPNVLLEFPPAWKIDFVVNNAENTLKLPKIYGCYLTDVSTTFGEDRMMFTPDGSPLQMRLKVSFKEVRTLNRLDIIAMESSINSGTRGVDDNFKTLGTFSSDPNLTASTEGSYKGFFSK